MPGMLRHARQDVVLLAVLVLVRVGSARAVCDRGSSRHFRSFSLFLWHATFAESVVLLYCLVFVVLELLSLDGSSFLFLYEGGLGTYWMPATVFFLMRNQQRPCWNQQPRRLR